MYLRITQILRAKFRSCAIILEAGRSYLPQGAHTFRVRSQAKLQPTLPDSSAQNLRVPSAFCLSGHTSIAYPPYSD